MHDAHAFRFLRPLPAVNLNGGVIKYAGIYAVTLSIACVSFSSCAAVIMYGGII